VLAQRYDSAGSDADRANTTSGKQSIKEDTNDPVSGAADSRAPETSEAMNEANPGVKPAISNLGVCSSSEQSDPGQHGSTQSSSTASKVTSGEGFHVFTCLDSYGTTGSAQETRSSKEARIPGTSSANVYLQEDLEEMNHFLGRQINRDERRTYQACPQRKRQEILDVLAVGTVDAGSSEKSRKAHQRKIDLFDVAESVFQVFLPLHFDGPTVGKFWGALHRLLTVSVDSDSLDMRVSTF
jgi:hypothetical protein